jgi:nicotinamidase-related amidase
MLELEGLSKGGCQMPVQIDPARTAVLALHFQVDVVKQEGAFGGPFFAAEVERRGIIPKAKVVLDAARKAGIRVIYTRVCFRPGYPDLIVNSPLFGFVQQTGALVEGSPGAEIIPELAPQPGDVVVNHRRASGFHESDLHVVLVANRINTLFVMGVASNVTVEYTARQASDYGYRVLVLEDCCAAASQAIHEASMESLKLLTEGVISSQDFLAAVGTKG